MGIYDLYSMGTILLLSLNIFFIVYMATRKVYLVHEQGALA